MVASSTNANSKTMVPSLDDDVKRIDQIYSDMLDLDGKQIRINQTFKVNVKELAYRYENAINKGFIDLPVGFIFDQIITKMKNQGFSTSSINYVYDIFEDPFMQHYKRKQYKPHQDTEKNLHDNNVKTIVARLKSNLEQIKKDKALLNDEFTKYDPKEHNPTSQDHHDYRTIKDDLSVILPPGLFPDLDVISLTDIDDDAFTNAINDNPGSSIFENEDAYFNKKYPNLDPDNLNQDLDPETNPDIKIRVKNNSEKPVWSATAKAYAENIKSRQKFLDMLLHNPIIDPEIDQRYAMFIDLDTRNRNMMTDDKSSHDLRQWLYIQIERREQSINSASSKSAVAGFITGKYRRTTREQITGKELFLLKECLTRLNNRASIEIVESVISKNIFKPRIAEFHNERHDNLSEASFGISTLM